MHRGCVAETAVQATAPVPFIRARRLQLLRCRLLACPGPRHPPPPLGSGGAAAHSLSAHSHA
eukprot:3871327-Alexandrium_andersonii.AAC.1